MVEAATNRASHEIANYARSTNILLVWWCCGTDIFDINKKRNYSNFSDDIDAWWSLERINE